jgi:mannose-6-phosphate isomerase-like protein (cupin superfamily)
MPPSKINVLEAVDRKVKEVFHPFIVGDVNDSQVKVAKFGAEFDWHAHEGEDKAFFVLRGRIAIDFAMVSQKWAKVILSWSRAGSNTGLGRFRRSLSF